MKYRGSDGWFYDEHGVRRMVDPALNSTPPARSPAPETPEVPAATDPDYESSAGCLVLLFLLVGLPLTAAGIGFLLGGFGGFVAGLGLALCVAFAAVLFCVHVAGKRAGANRGEGK